MDVLLELAQADRGVLRQLTARFDVAATPDELVAATRQAIADATDFDERDINRNFDYDYEAYGEVKRNLGRLIASGQLRLAMQLALELMKQGSYQVEMSDEGLMTEDIEDCLSVVLEAAHEVRLACGRSDRLVLGDAPDRPRGLHRPTAPRGPAPSRRGGRGTITRRTFRQRPTGAASPCQRAITSPGGTVRHPNAYRPPTRHGIGRTGFARLPQGHSAATASAQGKAGLQLLQPIPSLVISTLPYLNG